MKNTGYQGNYVLSLTSKVFTQILINMTQSPHFQVDYEPMQEPWDTQITEFYDKWKYG